MMKFFFNVILLFTSFNMFCQGYDEVWTKLYPEIEKRIVEPRFQESIYNIASFGAIPNDSTILNTEPINRAISICSINGGGSVIIPRGIWYTAPITLKSGVNLHLEEDAVLRFTTNPKFFPTVLTRWEGWDCYNLQPLIYAYGETNIAITGKGIIDGAAHNDNWWKKCGAPRFGWREGDISQKTGRPKLIGWSNSNFPFSQRILTEDDGMRPQTINFYLCRNVLIEGVKIIRSPFWVIHPLMCENVTVRGVTIDNSGPNGDGCNPESCKDVLIENCYFNTGDDCIAIKSGRNNDGRFWSKPSENIIVRNNQMKNGHGGVVIGSEISGGFKNLFVENCHMDSPALDRAIRIKTSNLRGGVIENIFVRNVEIGECREAVLRINLLYEQNEIGERIHTPVVRNVHLDHVTCHKSRYGVLINAFADTTAVMNIHVSNSEFENIKSGGNKIEGLVEDVKFTNLKINNSLIQ